MNISFDRDKDRANRSKHHISLERAKEFDFKAAKFTVDDSQNYGEVRWIAIGFLGANLYTVFTEDEDGTARIINLRKSEPEERREYEEEF